MTPVGPKQLVFVMGPTNAGKSTLLDYAEDLMEESVHTVNVGKMFREKYHPGHFQGQAAPVHTRREAWDWCYTSINEGLVNPEVTVILVDGQPRSVYQVGQCVDHFNDRNITKRFILLNASEDVRTARIGARFTNPIKEAAAIELAKQRIKNDMVTYYDVLTELLRLKQRVHVYSTNESVLDFGPVVLKDIDTADI